MRALVALAGVVTAVGCAGEISFTGADGADGGLVEPSPVLVAPSGVDDTEVPADCLEWLDFYGVDYELGPERQGIATPVTVTTPINGIEYRYYYNDDPRATFLMDCSLAHALAKAAPIMRARDVVEVLDIGVYNYRCIGEGEPPDCPNGMSQHAYAKAIDMAGFTTSAGDYYSVEFDWVIDASDETTCDAVHDSDADAFLHDLACEMKAKGVWNIVLTPNYNAGHRNHFHVDLTTGSNFIRRETLPEPIVPELAGVSGGASAFGTR
jgi:hypothetical protein